MSRQAIIELIHELESLGALSLCEDDEHLEEAISEVLPEVE